MGKLDLISNEDLKNKGNISVDEFITNQINKNLKSLSIEERNKEVEKLSKKELTQVITVDTSIKDKEKLTKEGAGN